MFKSVSSIQHSLNSLCYLCNYKRIRADLVFHVCSISSLYA